jgi:hypothetical protein
VQETAEEQARPDGEVKRSKDNPHPQQKVLQNVLFEVG